MKGKALDANMPQTTHRKRVKPSVAAQLALAERVLRGVHKQIDEEINRACALECEHALALYKTGKNPICDGAESLREARRRVG
jgi:hypothetical protein